MREPYSLLRRTAVVPMIKINQRARINKGLEYPIYGLRNRDVNNFLQPIDCPDILLIKIKTIRIKHQLELYDGLMPQKKIIQFLTIIF